MTREEIEENRKRRRKGLPPLRSANEVKDFPAGFRNWVSRNSDRIASAAARGKLPYFLCDNGTMEDGQWVAKVQTAVSAAAQSASQPTEQHYSLRDIGDAGYNVEGDYEDSVFSNVQFDYIGFKDKLDAIVAPFNVTGMKYRVAYEHEKMSLSIHSNDNKFTLERSFYMKEGRMMCEHELFVLDEALQGQGISKAVFRALYNEYNRMGVDVLKVFANIDVGGYTWAKYGFYASLKSGPMRRWISNVESFKSVFDEFYSQHSDDTLFPMIKIAEMPGGKEFLKGKSWLGFLDFSNNEQKAIFERYLGSD